MPRNQRCIRGGWTLVETLVSIAIVAVLIAILFPAVQAVRESARKTQCQNNLKQTALAVHAFHNANKSLPSPYSGTSLSYPLKVWDQFHMHSWRAALLPYLEQTAIHDAINWHSLATDRVNESVASTVVSPYICPSGASPTASMGWVFPRARESSERLQEHRYRVVRSDYDALAGIGIIPKENPYDNHIRWGVWGRPTLGVNEFGFECDTEANLIRYRAGQFKDVSDGLSNTVMVVERGGRPLHMVDGHPKVTDDNPNADYGGQVGWSASNSFGWRTNHSQRGVNHDNGDGIYSDHANGAYVAMADGSVTFLSESTDIATLAKMIGRSDGEP